MMSSVEKQESKKWSYYCVCVLRWIGVIPAAIAAAVVIPVIIQLGNELAQNYIEKHSPIMARAIGIWMTTFGELVRSAVSGIVFVVFGAFTAPNAKVTVAGVLAVLWCLLQIYLIALGGNSLWMLVNLVCSALAPFFGFRLFYRGKDDVSSR